ncbi:MAG TPA: hypothetical protein VK913_00545 [Erythrobacter sp.]|nr:hypothetical protein [Erythrobacter sp.]
MEDIDFQSFRREIVKLGFYEYSDQMSLLQLGRKCAKSTGLALGGMGAAGTAALGPGAALGFLAGLATGTAACTAGSMIYREQIKQILADEKGK